MGPFTIWKLMELKASPVVPQHPHVGAPTENGFMGMGIGAAMTGLRVIIEGMNMGFLLLAYNQISNNAGMLHYTSGGQFKVRRTGFGKRLGNRCSCTRSRDALSPVSPPLLQCVTSVMCHPRLVHFFQKWYAGCTVWSRAQAQDRSFVHHETLRYG